MSCHSKAHCEVFVAQSGLLSAGSWLTGECAVLIVFKQGLLLMCVLLLSIFMAVVINSVCVKWSQIQNKEVILVYVFAGNSLWHH